MYYYCSCKTCTDSKYVSAVSIAVCVQYSAVPAEERTNQYNVIRVTSTFKPVTTAITRGHTTTVYYTHTCRVYAYRNR